MTQTKSKDSMAALVIHQTFSSALVIHQTFS